MSVVQGSSLKKLIATKVETNQIRERPAKVAQETSATGGVQKSLGASVESSRDAAVTITRLAQASLKPEGSEKKIRERKEIEKVNRAASQTTVEDVERLADLLSDRIKDNPDEAVRAQGKITLEKVENLLG